MQTAYPDKPAVHSAGFAVSGASAPWRACLPRIAGRAAALDASPAFPEADIADLAQVGLLLAPLPPAYGGAGWGTTPDGGPALLAVLRGIGGASLAVGRLFEAHVNALALIVAYGAPGQIAAAARDAQAGHMFGLWVTDGAVPLVLAGGILQGGKAVCSGAGHIQRAVVTANLADGTAHMALVALPPAARAAAGAFHLTGMRAAVTGAMDFTGLAAEPVGQPGDYLREPLFSAGAWRTAAVTLGGLEYLIECVGQELSARGRADNPHQRARLGRLLILGQTAALWMERAALVAEARQEPPACVTGYVNLARLAVEAACLEAVTLAQRALGLNAFIAGRPVERLMRDLATYLRQPAADEALCEAAGYFLAHPMPR